MTREEAIQEVCSIVAMAYKSIGNHDFPSDGFCKKCQLAQGDGWKYKNSGFTIDYVRLAVVRQLHVDGYEIAKGWDKHTGKEKQKDEENE